MKKPYLTLPLRVSVMLFVLCITASIYAQDNVEKLREIYQEDSTVLDGLAGFDQNIRTDVLRVSKNPELMDRLIEIRNSSQEAFQKIIDPYKQDVQFGLYELSRYPELINALTVDGKKSKKEVEQVVMAYPEDIHESGKKYGRKQYKALASINHLNEKNKEEFAQTISTYDEDVQNSIKRLLDYPEILGGMSENMELVRLIGDAYRKSPEEVEAKLKKRHNKINEQKAKELADYQKQLEEDEEAMAEMIEAAKTYTAENGGDNVTKGQKQNVEIVHVHHYSYWYGYPYWYASPYWRPYPWYFHTGFYYGPGGRMVFIGMPSYYYVGWHHRRYPNRYPHLSYHYCRHSYRHPHSRYNFNRTVNANINNNVNVNRDNLVRIDNRMGNQVMRPSTRPGNAGNGNINRPATTPSQRPSTRPSNVPNQRPSQTPTTKPAQTPTSRPSTTPSQRPMNYNNYRQNESFRQPTTRPASRPASRPAGGRRR